MPSTPAALLRHVGCDAQGPDGFDETLSPRFDAIYAKIGRPSVPPEKLLRALLLQVLYTIRSEPSM